MEIDAFPGGFRRIWPGIPQRLPLSRDTSLVREVLCRGGNRLVEAARIFGSWSQLMALAEAGWLGPQRASQLNSLIETGERLVSISATARSIEELAACPPNSVAFVTGTVLGVRGRVGQDPVWECRESKYQLEEFFRAEDPWPLPEESDFVETAYDFLIGDAGAQALVEVRRAYLVATSRLMVGTRIGVLGYVDSTVDPAGQSTHRGPPTLPVLRSGPALPLLVLLSERTNPTTWTAYPAM